MATKKKSNLFKTGKQIKSDIQGSIMESVAALAGGIGANIGYGQLKKVLPEKGKKFTGVIVATVGTAGNAVSNNPLIKAGSNGITGASGAMVIEDLAPPEMKAKIGLSGIGRVETMSDEDLQNLEAEMLKEFNAASGVNGVEEDIEKEIKDLENLADGDPVENVD